MKSVGLFAVPLELVTWIVPLVVPATIAQIVVAETILNEVTSVPPISTLDTSGLLKSVPVITITQPAGPLVGENNVMVGETANAGVSRPSMSEAAAIPTPARRRRRRRFARVMASSSHSASQIQSGASRGWELWGTRLRNRERLRIARLLSALVLTQHADQHRPKRPILLAVDQELGEGAALRIAPEPADPVGPLEVCRLPRASRSRRPLRSVGGRGGAGVGCPRAQCAACGWQPRALVLTGHRGPDEKKPRRRLAVDRRVPRGVRDSTSPAPDHPRDHLGRFAPHGADDSERVPFGPSVGGPLRYRNHRRDRCHAHGSASEAAPVRAGHQPAAWHSVRGPVDQDRPVRRASRVRTGRQCSTY